ncbi:MAG TPA: hypothetical protein VHI98_07020 [Vicinamibacterales bacterium]|jgi:hypothetical protein|nr:hypothetical protein [Vicinamibacterales bacterium]HEX2462823.1 hypothetical protein [Vicinamibacterales bacterium]
MGGQLGSVLFVCLFLGGVAQPPHHVAPNSSFRCNTGYTERDCNVQLGILRRVLGAMDLTPLGQWTWVLVKSDDWKPILHRVHRDPDSPAFTILEKRQIFLEEALFNPRPDRARTLIAKWRMPLDELLPFSVGHELGHALCEEVDEKKANEYGAQFRDMATIRCVPR